MSESFLDFFNGMVVLDRLGFAAVQQSLFDEPATILNRVTTHREPIFVLGNSERIAWKTRSQLRIL